MNMKDMTLPQLRDWKKKALRKRNRLSNQIVAVKEEIAWREYEKENQVVDYLNNLKLRKEKREMNRKQHRANIAVMWGVTSGVVGFLALVLLRVATTWTPHENMYDIVYILPLCGFATAWAILSEDGE